MIKFLFLLFLLTVFNKENKEQKKRMMNRIKYLLMYTRMVSRAVPFRVQKMFCWHNTLYRYIKVSLWCRYILIPRPFVATVLTKIAAASGGD